jgi:hypothetical protein
VKVSVLLADKGSPSPTGLNLLNVGWSAAPLRMIGTPPATVAVTGPMAVVAFIEADLSECNRQLKVEIELIDQDGHPVQVTGPAGPQPMRAEFPLLIPTQAGAPSGFPGRGNVMFEIVQGLPLAPGTYKWRVRIEGSEQEDWSTRFFVPPPPPAIIFGNPTPSHPAV